MMEEVESPGVEEDRGIDEIAESEMDGKDDVDTFPTKSLEC